MIETFKQNILCEKLSLYQDKENLEKICSWLEQKTIEFLNETVLQNKKFLRQLKKIPAKDNKVYLYPENINIININNRKINTTLFFTLTLNQNQKKYLNLGIFAGGEVKLKNYFTENVIIEANIMKNKPITRQDINEIDRQYLHQEYLYILVHEFSHIVRDLTSIANRIEKNEDKKKKHHDPHIEHDLCPLESDANIAELVYIYNSLEYDRKNITLKKLLDLVSPNLTRFYQLSYQRQKKLLSRLAREGIWIMKSGF